MEQSTIPLRVRSLNVEATSSLNDAIAEGLQLLTPHRTRIERCNVELGCWVQHHDVGRNYRVAISLEPGEGALPLSVECESQPNPPREVLLELVRESFSRTARRLAAREKFIAYARGAELPLEAPPHHPDTAPAGMHYLRDER